MTFIIAQHLDFSISPRFIAFQILNILTVAAYFYLLVISVVTVVRKGYGTEIPLWILTIFLVPVVGPFAALYYYKSKPKRSK